LKVLLFPLLYKGGEEDILGRWVGLRGIEDIIKTKRPVGEAVTGAVFEYLERAGFDVSMAPAGLVPDEFDINAIKGPSPDLLLQGSIDKFTIKGVSRFGYTEIKSELRLRLIIENLKDSSILTVNILSSSEPNTVVSFAPEIFGTTVNEALAEAIEKIFAKTVLNEGVLRQAPEL
jgi:hypothetical protein